jgi:hypothetical protein
MTTQRRRWLMVLVMWLCATVVHGTRSGRVFYVYKSYNPFFVLLAILGTLNGVVRFLCSRLEERAGSADLDLAETSAFLRV